MNGQKMLAFLENIIIIMPVFLYQIFNSVSFNVDV